MAATQAASTKTKVESGASTTATTPLSPRAQVGKQILIYHFILIGISSVYYLLRGFDFEEFTALMGILAPVTAMYGGAVFRYIGRSITEPTTNGHAAQPVNNMVKWLVHGHFVTVMLLISLKALAPNVLNFQDMIMFLTLVESALGVYMGNIILALFEPDKSNGKGE
ncbi:MAG: hypothetical protein JNK89_05385 [Saprospiraceae bacterium]|nr:hypothetical protein [Saprospiraceae bacterium]